MKNTNYIDLFVILGLGGFLILAVEFHWFSNYKGFALIPFMLVYYLGKYVGSRKQKRKD